MGGNSVRSEKNREIDKMTSRKRKNKNKNTRAVGNQLPGYGEQASAPFFQQANPCSIQTNYQTHVASRNPASRYPG
jgi:hypothetical protein